MKKCFIFLGFIIFSCEPTVCLEKEDFYLGLEGQVRNMGCKKGFGDLIVRKNHPQANAYLGYKFNENIAIELGYESTETKIKDSCIEEGESVNGVPLPAIISPAIFKTQIKVRGPHIDLVLSKKISDRYPVSILGSIGISSVTINCRRNLHSISNPPIPGNTRDMRKQSAALRAMGGLQYEFDNGIGVRASLSFVNTGKMVVKVRDRTARKMAVVPKVLPRDSFSFGVGIVIPF